MPIQHHIAKAVQEKPNKAQGCDLIPPRKIKNYKKTKYVHSNTFSWSIVNIIIGSSLEPDTWKHGQITPLYKKGSVLKPPFSRGRRAVKAKRCTKNVMYVQSCCLALLSYCSLTYSLSSPSWHLKLPIIYDTLWSVRNRIISGETEMFLLKASETFFCLIGNSFVFG